MLYALQAYAPEVGVSTAVAAACVAGISSSMVLETVVLRAWEGLEWRTAARTAASMSLISMVTMELAENAVQLQALGAAGGACVDPASFASAMPAAMLAGWLTPLPYNYFMLRKYGRGCH